MHYLCNVLGKSRRKSTFKRNYREMAEITTKTIDIDQILKNKMGSKAKWIPGPLVSWLKRIAHQDQVNAFLWESRDKVGTPWLEACVEYMQMTLQIEGMDNLPSKDDGRFYTIVSNHPLGGADGVALGAIIGRHFDSRFRYLVNDLLMYLPGLAPLCIPINKTGIFLLWSKQDLKATTTC